ncbi:enoyl-CoA hydratase/isomerase family protein [Halomonas sp. DP1Y21-3]|uniref:enoyl-CoA hydratase-related protein n=2 Tax=Halomonas TaxID=2745 RepID=UPI00163A46E1|nr:enoyl-CoA hydratase/isomerase family protein [Halomonas sp. DP1Y21-3]|tara:strand:- start:769 stop:1608 length:840 start_codon:yes stop_codon:yes gene_type:complete
MNKKVEEQTQNVASEASLEAGNGEPEMIVVERRERVGLIILNRPKSLNALNRQLAEETLAVLRELDADPGIGAIVITGNPRAFAAGADIEEMAEKSFTDFYMDDFLAPWDEVRQISKPIIAAVAGFALGGGCELALLCDMIIASDDAQFGQPEIKLGILPGIGGSQRLARSVGKAMAMDLVLTGRNIGAQEAKEIGLVARVVAKDELMQNALEAAHTIAGYNAPAVKMAKRAVNAAFETPLAEGLRQERLLFQAAFATEGQKEGMNAFVKKRAPVFRHR